MVSFLWYILVFAIGYVLSRHIRNKHPETATKIDDAVKNVFLKIKNLFSNVLDKLTKKD